MKIYTLKEKERSNERVKERDIKEEGEYARMKKGGKRKEKERKESTGWRE